MLIPLEYLAVSTDAPLADGRFVAIDQGAGLDWIAWARWLSAHPLINSTLAVAYASTWAQMVAAFLYNVHTRASQRNSELWWIIAFASVVTIIVGALLPAVSAWVYYGLADMSDFPHMQQFAALRAGTMRWFDLGNTQGLVQLPSFHTVLAIMLAYNFRHHRWLFPICLVLDALIVLACPTEGGHYFVDLPAGAIVAVLAIWAARALQRRLNNSLPLSCQSAAVDQRAFRKFARSPVVLR